MKLLINSQNLPLRAFALKIILLKGVIFLFLSPAQCLRLNWMHYSVPRKRLSILSTNKLGYCQGAEKFTKFNKIRFSWSKGRGDCLFRILNSREEFKCRINLISENSILKRNPSKFNVWFKFSSPWVLRWFCSFVL